MDQRQTQKNIWPSSATQIHVHLTIPTYNSGEDDNMAALADSNIEQEESKLEEDNNWVSQKNGNSSVLKGNEGIGIWSKQVCSDETCLGHHCPTSEVVPFVCTLNGFQITAISHAHTVMKI